MPFAVLGLYLVTSIIYIFPSGNPQPADFLLLLGIALTLLLVWRTLPNEPVLYLGIGLLLGWITLVNSFWFLATGDFVFIRKTSFYFYNSIVLVFVVALGSRDFDKLKNTIYVSCVVALFAQFLFLGMADESIKRATGTFNNPNQMGYWALLVMTCLAIARERTRLSVVDVLALGAGMYATMLAISKAAVICAMLLIAIAVARCGCRRYAGWLLTITLAGGVILQLATGHVLERLANLDFVEPVTRELSSLGETADEDVAKRGYRRLLEHPHYLAFGAGEGVFERLATGPDGADSKEFHSTLGNLIMSYGLVGLGLFLVLLALIFTVGPWTNVAYLVPIMLYGITHNGLRFSLFWVFLGLVFAHGRYHRRAPARRPRRADSPQIGSISPS